MRSRVESMGLRLYRVTLPNINVSYCSMCAHARYQVEDAIIGEAGAVRLAEPGLDHGGLGMWLDRHAAWSSHIPKPTFWPVCLACLDCPCPLTR
jgi:hypothetical protein